MASQTTENYLKALFYLSENQPEISVTDLSKEMHVSLPTANSMVKKLQEHEWVVYEKYKPLMLTKKGKKRAALIIRKHRLSEMYLVEKMGFGWEEVHDIAEQMEHIDSPSFFEKIDEILGHPTVDPHGSPIPNKDGSLTLPNYIHLSEVEIGKTAEVKGLTQSDREFLVYLNTNRIEIGTQIKIIAKELFDHTTQVSYSDFKTKTLSQKVTDKLLVEVI